MEKFEILEKCLKLMLEGKELKPSKKFIKALKEDDNYEKGDLFMIIAIRENGIDIQNQWHYIVEDAPLDYIII